MHATTDLFLVGWANVETCHHNGCSWHQVEFGVGGAIVRRPNKIAGEKQEQVQVSLETFKSIFFLVFLLQ